MPRPLDSRRMRFSGEASVELSGATMCGWPCHVRELLKHVVTVTQENLIAGVFVQPDATGLPILEGCSSVRGDSCRAAPPPPA